LAPSHAATAPSGFAPRSADAYEFARLPTKSEGAKRRFYAVLQLGPVTDS
jgi:hypothetical protein